MFTGKIIKIFNNFTYYFTYISKLLNQDKKYGVTIIARAGQKTGADGSKWIQMCENGSTGMYLCWGT